MLGRYLNKIRLLLRDEGLVAGSKKTFLGLWAVLKYVRSNDVLFVSSGAVGDSWRYRVKNVAEELNLHGIPASITIQDNIWLNSYADRFKVFIFHRVVNTPKISSFMEKIKEHGGEIMFETDDLTFDFECLKRQDFHKNLNDTEKKFFENGLGAKILKDPYVRTCTTTTSFLADKLREYGKEVFIVKNKLSSEDLKIARDLINKKYDAHGGVRIGYFSGTASHNKDFETVIDPLCRIMEKYPEVQLHLVGTLEFTNELNKFRDRIKKLSFAQREDHFSNVAKVDINLAPLEIGNPFCESKSELKFFEAGILRVPTVATATRTFREAIEDGVDGFVANDAEEWFEKLEKLVASRESRESMGDNARQKAAKLYSTESGINKEYFAYLKSKIDVR